MGGPGPSTARRTVQADPADATAPPTVAPPAPETALRHQISHVTSRREGPERFSLPWEGRVAHTWSAAMRSSPRKDPDDPHRNTLADLPRGTELRVVGRRGGWLQVELRDGRTGWVWQALVDHVAPSAFVLPPIVVSVDVPTVPESFLVLKRAEVARAANPAHRFSEEETDRIDLAASVLRHTGRYVVDVSTYRVSFAPAGTRRTIDTIEDFILFVETVERTYPAASPGEIASEVRQIWFSDPNWQILSAGTGIAGVDIETRPNPIADAFDMADLAPSGGASKPLVTPYGPVGMGHVMAGIDTAINGFSTAAAAAARGGDAPLKYTILATASGSDPRDFATWSGDLGQAYAEYLMDRYVRGVASPSLAGSMAAFATRDELVADIHGYLATEVSRATAGESPTGAGAKVSDILRNLYLVPKTSATGLTYRTYFERVTGRSGAALDVFMRDRVVAFARPWFAKRLVDSRGGWWDQEGWTKSGILDNALRDFDHRHATNESSAGAADKVQATVDELNRLLATRVGP